ncbi:MAG: signal transduction histidine kinase [Paracoccaceae bacterium]|jgi:signal transduction histidine kinase
MTALSKEALCRPPIPINDQARLAELYRFEILDTLPEEAFDRLTALTALTFNTPIALVTFVDRHRHWFKSQVGFPIPELPRENGFCGHTIMNDEIMVVPDATQDVRFANDPAVTGPAAIRFYAGAPLTLPSGFRLGTLCMMDKNPRPEGLSEREREILLSLSALVVREIEYRQEITNETIDLSDELLNAQSAKQQFLQMLSHELRTPLNAVLGFSTLIATAPDDCVVPKYREYADDIAQAGDHLLKLIDGMLDWTRLERGELGIEDSVVPVPDLIKKAIGLIPSADQRIDVLPMPHLPELRCDSRYVVQIFAHVISNAVTFSPDGERVTIGVSVSDERNLVVRVTDSGPGVSDETRTRAFGVFEKFDPAGTPFSEGIGLGLPISRKLMEVHGGSIDFVDDQQCGATVVLAFPAHRTVM